MRSTASNAALPPVSAKVVPTPEADRGVPVDARRVREGLVREVSYLQESSGALQTCQGLWCVVQGDHDLSVGAGRCDHASQPSTLATAEVLASEVAGGDEGGQRGEVTAVASTHRIADGGMSGSLHDERADEARRRTKPVRPSTDTATTRFAASLGTRASDGRSPWRLSCSPFVRRYRPAGGRR